MGNDLDESANFLAEFEALARKDTADTNPHWRKSPTIAGFCFGDWRTKGEDAGRNPAIVGLLREPSLFF